MSMAEQVITKRGSQMAGRESDYSIVPLKQGNSYRGKAVTYYRPFTGKHLPTQRGVRMQTKLERFRNS